MDRPKNILVALDLSKLDDILIKYASFIADRLHFENVYFVHNIKKYEISSLFEEHLKDINIDEVIDEELNEKINENFTAKTNWEVLLSDDPYSESLIKYVVDKYAIQLAIVGNKNKLKGTGVVSGKLLRLLKCNILAVPETAEPKINNIWAGVDFSNESRKIFKVTKLLQENHDTSLKMVHVYSVPVHFSPYLSIEKIAPDVEKHVKEKFEKFIKKINYSESFEQLLLFGRESSVARRIAINIKDSKADLLIVADKGGNTFSPFSVGSVTEELFNENLEIPLWIVK